MAQVTNGDTKRLSSAWNKREAIDEKHRIRDFILKFFTEPEDPDPAALSHRSLSFPVFHDSRSDAAAPNCIQEMQKQSPR